MAFPSPPWHLNGQLWGSLIRATPPGGQVGTYLTAFVSYEAPGTLSYSELLVARRAEDAGRSLTVRDIWADSAASVEGGRALWSMPKHLADFSREGGGLGLVGRDTWSVAVDGAGIASAQFADVSRLALRLPFRGSAQQPRITGGTVVARLRGSGKALPCLAHWTFEAGGPLGWLATKQPLVSFRIRDFALDLH